jgi:hypothetical protein
MEIYIEGKREKETRENELCKGKESKGSSIVLYWKETPRRSEEGHRHVERKCEKESAFSLHKRRFLGGLSV